MSVARLKDQGAYSQAEEQREFIAFRVTRQNKQHDAFKCMLAGFSG